jgi:uncharacterized surface protein with fasciclin (FAS1) repeats
MRKKLTRLVLGASAVAIAAGSTVATATTAREPTLADILLSDGDQFDSNPADYDIVTEAVLLFPHLVAAASDPDAELTAFLPNDWAFRKLVRNLTGHSPIREKDVFDAVAALGTDTVATVLTYHLIAGPPISFAAAKQSDNAVLTTLQGSTVTVDVKGRYGKLVKLIDNDPDAPDARIVQGDVGGAAANGYAHGINRVLRPVDL